MAAGVIQDKKKPTKKKPLGSAPGSGGLGPWMGGVKNNPAIIPGVREQ
jgi:hypothetical protein